MSSPLGSVWQVFLDSFPRRFFSQSNTWLESDLSSGMASSGQDAPNRYPGQQSRHPTLS